MKFSELRLSRDFINIIIFNFRSPGKTLKSPLLHQCDKSVCFGIALCYSIFPLNTKLEILFYIEQRYRVNKLFCYWKEYPELPFSIAFHNHILLNICTFMSNISKMIRYVPESIQAAVTKIPQTGVAYEQQTLISHRSGGHKSKIKVPADPVSAAGPLPGSQTVTFSLRPHETKRITEPPPPRVSLIRPPILFLRAAPEAPAPSIVTPGTGCHCLKSVDIQSPAILKCQQYIIYSSF